MNVTYGGCATMMHTTKIMKVRAFERVLNIGDTQSMNFSIHDPGPFWLSSMDKLKTKYDRKVGGRKLKKLNKIEMLTELRKHGVDTISRRFKKKELVELCRAKSIPTQIIEEEIKYGWANKPKGMLQVLFERGWIDTTKVQSPRSSRYSINGKKGDFIPNTTQLKKECEQYCLTYLLNKCFDFNNEKCDLEHLCDRLSERNSNSCSVIFTPKFHCELAGEGIEY